MASVRARSRPAAAAVSTRSQYPSLRNLALLFAVAGAAIVPLASAQSASDPAQGSTTSTSSSPVTSTSSSSQPQGQPTTSSTSSQSSNRGTSSTSSSSQRTSSSSSSSSTTSTSTAAAGGSLPTTLSPISSPPALVDVSAALFDTDMGRIYYVGGTPTNNAAPSPVSLSLSSPWPVSNPLWSAVSITDDAGYQASSALQASRGCVVPVSNDVLRGVRPTTPSGVSTFLGFFGVGADKSKVLNADIYTYKPTTGVSSQLSVVQQKAPRSRHSAACVQLDVMTAFVFGGLAVPSVNPNDRIDASVFADTWYLDLAALSTSAAWDQPNLSPVSPPPMYGHTAVVMKDGTVIMVGGITLGQDSKPVEMAMDVAWQFDPQVGYIKLSLSSDSQVLPQPRKGHSFVIPDPVNNPYKILMYGGTNLHEDVTYGDVWQLDVSNTAWKLLTNGTSSQSRYDHVAFGLNGVMIAAFGKSTETAADLSLKVWDTSVNGWVTSLPSSAVVGPGGAKNNVPKHSSPKGDNTGASIPYLAIGASVGALLVVGGLVAAFVVIRKRSTAASHKNFSSRSLPRGISSDLTGGPGLFSNSLGRPGAVAKFGSNDDEMMIAGRKLGGRLAELSSSKKSDSLPHDHEGETIVLSERKIPSEPVVDEGFYAASTVAATPSPKSSSDGRDLSYATRNDSDPAEQLASAGNITSPSVAIVVSPVEPDGSTDLQSLPPAAPPPDMTATPSRKGNRISVLWSAESTPGSASQRANGRFTNWFSTEPAPSPQTPQVAPWELPGMGTQKRHDPRRTTVVSTFSTATTASHHDDPALASARSTLVPGFSYSEPAQPAPITLPGLIGTLPPEVISAPTTRQGTTRARRPSAYHQTAGHHYPSPRTAAEYDPIAHTPVVVPLAAPPSPTSSVGGGSSVAGAAPMVLPPPGVPPPPFVLWGLAQAAAGAGPVPVVAPAPTVADAAQPAAEAPALSSASAEVAATMEKDSRSTSPSLLDEVLGDLSSSTAAGKA
ncbi:hypothetical protein DFJ73DRAFT_942894 [Zopfochytrium polystomum]|nr:hypothetical protein DFJ73DRAFT_942894 [Zopfochytrium polystomum]